MLGIATGDAIAIGLDAVVVAAFAVAMMVSARRQRNGGR